MIVTHGKSPRTKVVLTPGVALERRTAEPLPFGPGGHAGRKQVPEGKWRFTEAYSVTAKVD